VRDPRRAQLPVEEDVLAAEAGVPRADVEREEGRAAQEDRAEPADERVGGRASVRGLRADVGGARPAWVGRVEVAAPGLHDGEGVEMVQRQERRAVAAGGEADDRAPPAGADRPEPGIDEARELDPHGCLPVAAGAPVQVLRVGVAVPRALRRDENRRPAGRVERVPQVVDPAVCARPCGKTVQEIDHRVPRAPRAVARREVHRQVDTAADGARGEGRLDGRSGQRRPRRGLGGDDERATSGKSEQSDRGTLHQFEDTGASAASTSLNAAATRLNLQRARTSPRAGTRSRGSSGRRSRCLRCCYSCSS